MFRWIAFILFFLFPVLPARAQATSLPTGASPEQPFINVKDRGAIGDGVTDDYDALLSVVAEINAAGGGTVYFPPGTYRINRYRITGGPEANGVLSLVYESCNGLTIRGDNATIDVKGDFHRTATNYARSVTPVVLRNCRNVIVEGLVLDGNVDQMTRDDGIAETAAHGLVAGNTRDYLIRNVTAHHFLADGFYLGNSSSFCDRNATVENVHAYANGRMGLTVIHVRGLTVRDSVFEDSGRTGGQYGGHNPQAGIDVEPLDNVVLDVIAGDLLFERCTLRGNMERQFQSRGNDKENITLRACTIDGTAGRDINTILLVVPNGVIEDCDLTVSQIVPSTPGYVSSTIIRNNRIRSAYRGITDVAPSNGGPVLIEGNEFIGTHEGPYANWFPYIENPGTVFRNNTVFMPGAAKTSTLATLACALRNVARSEGNRFRTDYIPQGDEHFYTDYTGVETIVNDVYESGTAFRPGPSSTHDTTLPYNRDLLAPSVAITDPVAGATLYGTATISAQAEDNVSLLSVDFYAANALINSVTAPPYQVSWNTSNVPKGAVTLKAVATDTVGRTAQHSVSVSVDNTDATPPTVTLTAPADGSTVAGTVLIQAAANDNRGIAEVRFYVDATPVGTVLAAPYQTAWDSSTLPDGVHTIRAEAEDTAGNTSSDEVTVTVDNVPNPDTVVPTVTLTSPVEGATISSLVTITAEAGDNVGVASVDFYAGSTLLASIATPPYVTSWDTAPVANGPVIIRAVATDTAGLSAESVVNVTIDNPDVTPPSVTLVTPADGAVVTGAITIQATADDDRGVTEVRFTVGDVSFGTDSTAPWEAVCDTSILTEGTHTVRVEAVDAAGHAVTDEASVVVDNVPDPDTTPPTVALTSPSGGSVLAGDVTVSALAGDDVALRSVDFYAGTTLIASVTAPPYQASWNTRAVTNGQVIVKAIATDTAGQSTEDSVSVTVDNPDVTDPTVSLDAPSGGSVLTGTVTLQATATDDRGVSEVRFSVDGVVLGADSAAPYEMTLDTVALGDGAHTLRVEAFDAAGNTSSDEVSVTVENVPDPDLQSPTVTLTGPAGGSVLSGTVTVSADASDNVGVASVSFYAGTTLIDSDNTAPYEIAWDTTTSPDGTVVLRAVATDAAGNTSEQSVTVTVENVPDPDVTAPTVTLTSPAGGATVSGSVMLQAGAQDDRGVTEVRFTVNGAPVGAAGAAPYEASWDTTALADGAYIVRAEAVDAAGNVASDEVTVTVDNVPDADTTPPTVSIASPTNGAKVTGSINVRIAAQDNVAVVKTELYVDGQLAGSSTKAPYTIRWDSSRVSKGNHTLTARAYDAAGNSGVAAPVTVNVASKR